MDKEKCQWYELYMFGKSRENYQCGCVGNRFEIRATVPDICPYCGKKTEIIQDNSK